MVIWFSAIGLFALSVNVIQATALCSKFLMVTGSKSLQIELQVFVIHRELLVLLDDFRRIKFMPWNYIWIFINYFLFVFTVFHCICSCNFHPFLRKNWLLKSFYERGLSKVQVSVLTQPFWYNINNYGFLPLIQCCKLLD